MSQLAQVLEKRQEDILQRWVARVRQQLATGHETRAELADHLPLFLRQLQAALRGESSQAGTSQHGAQRFRLGFPLGALVREYGLLRDVLLDLLVEERLQVSLEEVRLLTDFVATAIAEAVEEHARQQERAHQEERRRQEAERERAERARAAVLDALAEQTLVALSYVRGPRHVFETANPLFRQLMARDVVGLDVWSAFPELLGPKFPAVMTQVFQSGVPYVAREIPMCVNQGPGLPPRDFLFDLTYQPVRSPEGEIDGVLTLAIEVTEQVRLRREAEKLAEEERARRDAEQRLRVRAEDERARLNALFQQAPVALGILRGSDIIIEVANPSLCRLWGRTPEQVLGLPAMDALPELRGMGLDDLVRGVMATGVPFVATELQVHLSRGPGGALTPGFFNFVYDALRDEQGDIEGVILIAVEVTEQVLARQSAQGLAQEERRLRDFERHLIGIVSHDLRNPLGAILLGLQLMLRREGLDARNTQSLVRLKSSAERAVRMVRDLLDFTEARLGGGLKMERALVDVHALVRGVVDELLVTHPTRELRLEQLGEGRAHWDEDRVAQLLGNLMINALKYSPANSPVTVRSTGGLEDVRLEVHNGGAPIPPEALPRLFQPLQRAVEGIDKATRSVGLGLYIVDQIVRAHGGDVQVTSNENEGTCFTVRLPRGH